MAWKFKERDPFDPATYPRPQTAMGRIVECLEAEPAPTREVTVYIGKNPVRTKALLQQLRMAGLVERCPGKIWRLVSPETAALAYVTEEDFDEAVSA